MKNRFYSLSLCWLLLAIPSLTHADESTSALSHYCRCLTFGHKASQPYSKESWETQKEKVCQAQIGLSHPNTQVNTLLASQCPLQDKAARPPLGTTMHGLKETDKRMAKRNSKDAAGFGLGSPRRSRKADLKRNTRIIVLGALSKNKVHQVITKAHPQIKKCFLKKKQADGQISVQFTVKENGKVSNPKVRKSTINSPIIHQCLTGQIQKLTFPRPTNGQVAMVKYTFIFK